MKKIQILLLTLLIPFLGSTQTIDSWVNFKVQYDFYGVQESNWFMVADSTGDTTIFHAPTTPYQFLDTTINLQSGNYTVTLNDSYGDGWTSTQPSWFKMENTCQGLIIDWQLQGVPFSLRDTTVSIWPCAPPTSGCTNPIAINYDSTATVDDGSCIFLSCGGFDSAWATQQCVGAQVLTYYEWTTSPNPNCNVIKIFYGTANFNQVYDVNISNGIWGIYMGSGQQPPTWNEERYFQVMFADSTLSDTLFYTPYSCIPGCTDPTADNYNPWATVDDGSCDIIACDSLETEITISLTLDGYPGETSWTLIDLTNGQPIDEVQVGEYDFGDVGKTFTYTYCVIGFEFILYDSYGDGLAGSTSGGTIDGSCTIYDCNGDTIWNLPNPGFGSVAYSGGQWPSACAGPVNILGCMDPAYQEYNPLANVNDSSCINLHIFGCIDSTAFNYNPYATAMNIVPICSYTLQIEDDGGDGWGNSYLGVTQGNNTWTFTMGPGSYSQSYPINLDTDEPVIVYYFQVGGPQQPPQQIAFQTLHNSFLLTNALGDTLLSEGTNPFYNNGQGALQPFKAPLWTTYSAMPYCGDFCIPAIYGCMDPSALNYNPLANTPTACTPIVLGCTNPLAFNFDPLANVDDSTCVSIIIGCMDSTAFNFNPSANTNDQASCIPVIYGCMDDTMFNYNAAANTDDGSCIPIVFGCTDINAFNYDSLANTNNGSCIPVIWGCTNATAFNFNPNANTDDGSCVPVVIGCTDPTALNFDSLANTNSGCVYPIYGCTDPTMFNYDVNANVDDGSCIPYIYGCTDSTAFNYDSLANTNVGCIYPVLGCTNPIMFNYNSLANTDDGSCVPFIYGCTDAMMWNYNPLANTDNGSCLPYVYGCTDSTQYNYDPLANTDNGTCIPYIYGCTDSSAFNYNQLANTDNGTCIPILYGCTDSSALNYNALANTDDGSCILPLYGCTDSTALNYNPLANTNDGSCIPYLYGCTDSTMFNFNPLANTNDGSCIPYVYGCTDPTMFNYDINANTDDGSCIPFIYGCTDPTMFNYNANANTDNGSCIPFIYGCIDSTMFNYNPTANTDNGSCIPFIYGCTDNTALNFNPLANTLDNSCCYIGGCTDSTAVNYNPLACYDDNSCIVPIVGCTDVSAYNYNPAANVSDSTACLYDAGCYGGPGIPYWLNDGCYAWVISVDDYCCTTSWDPTCQQMYDYCQLGWPTGIEDLGEKQILIYPNPTNGLVTIKAKGNIDVVIYDMLGSCIANFQSLQEEINLTSYKPGMYNLKITYRNKIINYRIVKQ